MHRLKVTSTVAAAGLAIAVLGTTPLGHAAGSVLLPKNSVGAAQLKTSAVTGAKVKNGSLVAADFKPGELPTGPKGDTGPQGSRGEAGPPGPTGVIDAVFVSGFGYNPASSLNKLGELAVVDVPAGARVHVHATKIVGTISNESIGLDAYICHRPQGTTPLQTRGDVARLNLRSPGRVPLTLSAVLTGLPSGKHEVGLCGVTNNFSRWNDNGTSYVTALVLR
jgi:hypothetical protein